MACAAAGSVRDRHVQFAGDRFYRGERCGNDGETGIDAHREIRNDVQFHALITEINVFDVAVFDRQFFGHFRIAELGRWKVTRNGVGAKGTPNCTEGSKI